MQKNNLHTDWPYIYLTDHIWNFIETVMIGDDIKDDVIGAQDCNFQVHCKVCTLMAKNILLVAKYFYLSPGLSR